MSVKGFKEENIVAVIGLGYVGLPLAQVMLDNGLIVIGIDSNSKKVHELNNGISEIIGIDQIQLQQSIRNRKFIVTADFHLVDQADVVLICVPTPLGKDLEPDLQFILNAVENIGEHLKRDALIVVESTVAPGTTRNIILPLLKETSKMSVNDFYVAFSPERIDPANSYWNVKNTPKLVSGLTPEATSKALIFYSKFVENIIECQSVEIAETAKLLENSFRLINISFMNELATFCNKLGIEINEVIKVASTKPYGFMPFYPSLGVGGHCIPVDPIYLSEKARELGIATKMIDLANQINKEMPDYFASRANDMVMGLAGKKVLIIGLSYKPNVADTRETPVEPLIKKLRKHGAIVSWHDDLVKEWNGEKSVALSDDYDLAILATPHNYLDLTKLGDVPILNTRGSV